MKGRNYREMSALGERMAQEIDALLTKHQRNVVTITKPDLCKIAGMVRFVMPHARELTSACRRLRIVAGFGECVAVFARDKDFAPVKEGRARSLACQQDPAHDEQACLICRNGSDDRVGP